MWHIEAWQWAIVAGVALANVVWIGGAAIRMFSRKADPPGVIRQATAFESGIADAAPPADAEAFDAFSYRVSARFAGRVRIVLYPERIAVAGPRTPKTLYRFWIWLQGMLLAVAPAAVAGAVVALDWRWLVLGVALAFLSWTVSISGAGWWPGLGELEIINAGRFLAVEFPRQAVDAVKVGAGWSDGGLAPVLWPYINGVDGLAAGRAVSFYAPDGEGIRARYALHVYSGEEARRLAEALRGSTHAATRQHSNQ